LSTQERLAALSAAGVSIWLDDLSRERLRSGNLAELIENWNVVGVTTNPTIFASALSRGDAYDQQIRELARRGADLASAIREITVADVRQACDLFRDTWKATGGVDGRVSLEVDPTLARDTDATVAEACDLWKAVNRLNLLVKIPATEHGLPAIVHTLAEGISVNVTLIFSVERYELVMDAYLDGIEQAAANGHDISRIASVASFFVSRVDTEIDTRLEANGSDTAGVTGYAAHAQQVFNDLGTAGIDLTDVFLTLENEGVEKFEKSWDEFQHSVRDQLAHTALRSHLFPAITRVQRFRQLGCV
jgi:transaldolase